MWKTGLWAGLITLLVQLVLYWWKPNLFFHPGVHYGGVLVILLFQYLGLKAFHQLDGYHLSFPVGLKAAFSIWAVAAGVFYLGILLWSWIDPKLSNLYFESGLQRYLDFDPKTTVEKARKTLLEDGYQLSFKSLLFAYLRGLIGGFGLSAFMAQVMRR